MSKQPVQTNNAPSAIGTYSQAIRSGNLVFLSGQIPLDPATMEIVEGDFADRAHRVFQSMRALAEAAGTNLDHAVKLTIYLTDLDNFATVNSVMAEYFSEPYPARAALEDLLFLLPLRYEDRTTLHRIGALKPGMRCLTSGEVLLAETVFRGRRSLLVRIGDGSGQLTLRFFHFSRQQQAQFRTGARVSCYGDVRPGRAGLEMVHPEYRLLRDDQAPDPLPLVPIGVRDGIIRLEAQSG